METGHANLTLAVALAAGVVGQSLARQLRIPAIILLLLLGVFLGPEGLGWVRPDSLGTGLFGIVDFAVAIILFEGGLNLELSRLRRQEYPIRGLITVGALITFAGSTVAVKMFLGWEWELALLFGSLVIVTGPTVIAPLIRTLRLRPHLKTVLEAEGVLIDPIGALWAILVLHLVIGSGSQTLAGETLGLLGSLVLGISLGLAGGLFLAWILKIQALVPHGYENIFALASIVLLFHGADQVMSQSGILAVTIAGVVVGNSQTPMGRDLREFKDQLTILLVGLLFILLAAGVRLEDVEQLGWPGGFVISALILVVRPFGVWLSTKGSTLSWPERLFMS